MAPLLLLVHAVVSVFLLGAVTHQAAAILLPALSGRGFVRSFRSVNAARYAVPIAVLYALQFGFGACLYPAFRVDVRAAYLDASAPWAVRLFEIKEHAAALGLGILPAYVAVWHRPPVAGEPVSPRRWLTLFLALVAWGAFAIGHVVNNVRGL